MASHQTNAATANNSSQPLSAIVMLSMVLLLFSAYTVDARPETLSALSANMDDANVGVGVGVLGAPLYMTRTVELPSPAFWHELLTNTNNINEQALYTELRKDQQRHEQQQQQLQQQQEQHHQQQQPNYLTKWPGLRDLLLTADYDDNMAIAFDAANPNANANANAIESNELVNSRFVERLRQLAATAVDDLEDARADNHAAEVLPATATVLPQRKPAPPVPSNMVNFKEHGIKKNVQYMSPCHFKICNMGRKRNARSFDD